MQKKNKKFRKLMFILGVSGILVGSMTACGAKEADKNTSDVKEKDSKKDNKGNKDSKDNEKKEVVKQKEDTKKKEEESEKIGFSYGDLQDIEFWFGSGAGAWCTTLTVEADGSFSGVYHDSDAGDTGDGYQNGICYISKFSGQFGKLKKVNDYTYSAKVQNLELENKPDTEEIVDGIKYIYSKPYGIDGAQKVLFYVKGAPITELPEEYLSWVSYDIDTATKLPFYGLYNEAEENGFMGEEAVQEDGSDLEAELTSVEQQEKEIENKIKKASTQLELNEASLELYQLWDDELNTLWARLKETLDEDTMQTLTEEERQWITEKEAAMEEAGAECEGGSMQPMVKNQKGADLTKERVYELVELLR